LRAIGADQNSETPIASKLAPTTAKALGQSLR